MCIPYKGHTTRTIYFPLEDLLLAKSWESLKIPVFATLEKEQISGKKKQTNNTTFLFSSFQHKESCQ